LFTVFQILFCPLPAFRPFREIRAYFDQFTHNVFITTDFGQAVAVK
jgi:hypothetical protein